MSRTGAIALVKQETLRAVNARWEHHTDFEDEVLEQLGDLDTWVVVERSTITGEYCLSTYQDLTVAHDWLCKSQEYAEDWEPRVAVHLLTGTVVELQRTYDWDTTETYETVDTYDDWRR